MYKWEELTPEQKGKVIKDYVAMEDDMLFIHETMVENLVEGCTKGDLTQQAFPLTLADVIDWWDEGMDDEGRKEMLTSCPTSSQ